MAKTVEEGFRIFHGRLTPTGGETEAAKKHRASVEACLKSNFGITSFHRIGSFGSGTSVRNYSDVDFLACVPTEQLNSDSKRSLWEVWAALDTRFPNTGVAIKSPAVYVPFGTDASEAIDVVPADWRYTTDAGFRVYEIADGDGGWMETSPDAHKAYVDYVNSTLGGKVKPLIRFLKAWRYFRQAPIFPFYLEMATARYAAGEEEIVYSYDVKAVLGDLLRKELSAMQDPMGVTGYIRPCPSDGMKDQALSKLQTAYTRAEKARASEEDGRPWDAFYWWNLLFDDGFPAY